MSAIPPRLSARWTHARRFDVVRTLLREPVLDSLLTTLPFAEAPALYPRLAAGDHDSPPCHVFEYA